MPIGDFFGAVRRRWVLVLVGFLFTAGFSAGAYVMFKPTYEITATILLLPPAPIDTTVTTNPYLRLGGLQQAVDLVGVSLMDQATQLEFQDISKDISYTVIGDPRTSSPLLLIDVKDSSSQTALRIRDLLVERAPVRLKELQVRLGVESKDQVTSTVITLDKEAEEVGRNKLRAAVVVAAGGLALTLATAALWDAHLSRRPARRAADDTIPEAEPDATLLDDLFDEDDDIDDDSETPPDDGPESDDELSDPYEDGVDDDEDEHASSDATR